MKAFPPRTENHARDTRRGKQRGIGPSAHSGDRRLPLESFPRLLGKNFDDLGLSVDLERFAREGDADGGSKIGILSANVVDQFLNFRVH